MAVLPILLWPDPRLTAACAGIDAIGAEHVRLAEAMLETMYAAEGRGLAAPQVGQMIRLFVMDTTWKAGKPNPQIFYNPRILRAKSAPDEQAAETAVGIEGCLSIPDCPVAVRRRSRVGLAWTDAEGRDCEADFDGIEAICIQHECDHLDGILVLDHADPAALAALGPALDALRAGA